MPFGFTAPLSVLCPSASVAAPSVRTAGAAEVVVNDRTLPNAAPPVFDAIAQ